jgi:hypothetical protein
MAWFGYLFDNIFNNSGYSLYTGKDRVVLVAAYLGDL